MDRARNLKLGGVAERGEGQNTGGNIFCVGQM